MVANGPRGCLHRRARPVLGLPESGAARRATDIDAFILDGLRSKQLTPSKPLDRGQLIRRVTYDLTGLPPTPAEVDAFLKDKSPDCI